MYINHIGIYDDAAAIQAALNEGSLANPYVALNDDSGELDYNTLEPAEPIGEWESTEEPYNFAILDLDPSLWEEPIKIGTLNNVWCESADVNMDVMLSWDATNEVWHLQMESQDTPISEPPQYDFADDTPSTWDNSGISTVQDDSDSIVIDWDGTDHFEFYSNGEPLSMTTINV